jgi:hypothetical protein
VASCDTGLIISELCGSDGQDHSHRQAIEAPAKPGCKGKKIFYYREGKKLIFKEKKILSGISFVFMQKKITRLLTRPAG